MADTILLNNEVYQISEDVLPCLIHYTPESGGSRFTLSIVANLFLKGSKILFFTAYPMAKDDFLQQIEGMASKTTMVTDESQLSCNSQAIIIESGNENLFLQAVSKLDDIDERVILVKNIEVFGNAVFDSCLEFEKIIFSGDLDKCSMRKQISKKQYNATVLFNKSEALPKAELENLKKYSGYLWSRSKEGLVTVQMNNN